MPDIITLTSIFMHYAQSKSLVDSSCIQFLKFFFSFFFIIARRPAIYNTNSGTLAEGNDFMFCTVYPSYM